MAAKDPPIHIGTKILTSPRWIRSAIDGSDFAITERGDERLLLGGRPFRLRYSSGTEREELARVSAEVYRQLNAS